MKKATLLEIVEALELVDARKEEIAEEILNLDKKFQHAGFEPIRREAVELAKLVLGHEPETVGVG